MESSSSFKWNNLLFGTGQIGINTEGSVAKRFFAQRRKGSQRRKEKLGKRGSALRLCAFARESFPSTFVQVKTNQYLLFDIHGPNDHRQGGASLRQSYRTVTLSRKIVKHQRLQFRCHQCRGGGVKQ
jgi:hypothetical protein